MQNSAELICQCQCGIFPPAKVVHVCCFAKIHIIKPYDKPSLPLLFCVLPSGGFYTFKNLVSHDE